MLSPLFGNLNPLGFKFFASSDLLEFLLRDDYTTSDAAPVNTPRTCEPGAGILNFTQTGANNEFTISDERLIFPIEPNTGSSGALSDETFTRTPGLALATTNIIHSPKPNGTSGGFPAMWKASQNVDGTTTGGARWGLIFVAGTIRAAANTAVAVSLRSYWYGARYKCVTVLLSTGAVMFVKGANCFDWTCLFISTSGTNTPLYAGLMTFANGGLISQKTFRVAQLPEQFETSSGFVVNQQLSAEDCAVLDALFVGDDATITKQLVSSGDSISIGLAADTGITLFAEQATNILGSEWDPRSIGAGGNTIAAVTAANATRVLALYDATLERNLVVYYVGTPDILSLTSLATIQSNLTTLIQNAVAGGFEVVACTHASMGGTANDSAVEALRQDVATWLRAEYLNIGATYLADIANTVIGAPGACNNLTYSLDKVHLTNAAHAIMGQTIAAAISA